MSETAAGLPPIRRMRGWRLYGENGERYLDLRLLDNRGFLGAKGRFAGTRAKNGIDLGLLKEAPSRHAERLRKALGQAVPGAAAFRFYRCEERALEALGSVLAAGRPLGRGDLYDPLRRDPGAPDSGAPAAVQRFFLPGEEEARLSSFPARLVPLPCPAPFAPAVLAFSDPDLAAEAREDELAPLLPFAALRAWEDFRGLSTPREGGRRVRSGEGAPSYAEALWARTDRRLSAYFERKGPYLYPRCPEAGWPAFRVRALEGGCVLAPEWGLPSIVPGEYDDGELKKLASALERT